MELVEEIALIGPPETTRDELHAFAFAFATRG